MHIRTKSGLWKIKPEDFFQAAKKGQENKDNSERTVKWECGMVPQCVKFLACK